jgi:hypothetical protein
MNFFQGDLVSYRGSKFSSDLGGKMGEICAPVTNQKDHFVVAFGSDDYVLSESVLVPFQGHLRTGTDESKHPEKKEKKPKGPQVELRRGRSKQEDETESE